MAYDFVRCALAALAVGLGSWVGRQSSAQELHLVADLNQERSAEFGRGVNVGSKLFFSVRAGSQPEAVHWITDGTVAGTRLIELPESIRRQSIAGAEAVGEVLVFSMNSPPSLWAYDTTNDTVRRIAVEVRWGPWVIGPWVLYGSGGPTGPATGWRLRLDQGSAPELLPPQMPLPSFPSVVDGAMYFTVRPNSESPVQLWRYDPDSNTARVVDSGVALWNFLGSTPVAGRYLLGWESSLDRTCWVYRYDTQSGTSSRTLFLQRSDWYEAGPIVAFDRWIMRCGGVGGTNWAPPFLRTFNPISGTISNTQVEWGWYSPRNFGLTSRGVYLSMYNRGSGTELHRIRPDGGVELVYDIIPGAGGAWAGDALCLGAGDRCYFDVDDGVHGSELWVHDETTGETRLVRDIRPGADGCNPWAVGTLGGVLIFVADDGVHGKELWRSDGTEVGTFMLRDFETGTDDSNVRNFVALGSRIVFSASSPEGGRRLYGGSATGDSIMALTPPASGGAVSGDLPTMRLGDRCVFVLPNGHPAGVGYGVTDGTPEGTRVITIASGWSLVSHVALDDHRFVFGIERTDGAQLWISDGTPAGTQLVRDFGPPGRFGSYSLGSMASCDGRTYFRFAMAPYGSELWRTDGTSEGTEQVADLAPGTAGAFPRSLTPTPESLYFVGTTEDGDTLFRLRCGDRSPSALLASPAVPMFISITGFAGGKLLLNLFFSSIPVIQSWSYDPAADRFEFVSSTYIPSNIGGDPPRVLSDGRALYFTHSDLSWNYRPYGYDPTTNAITRLLATSPTYISTGSPAFLGSIRGKMLFTGDDGVHGHEIWTTDGPAGPARLFLDMVPGPNSSFATSARLVGDRLYIACTTPAYGAELYWVQICPADFTLDFAVTVDDVVGFVGAFEAGSSDADLDDGSGTMTLDGAVTIEDLLFFLDRFATGC